jgi:hypothetical protein
MGAASDRPGGLVAVVVLGVAALLAAGCGGAGEGTDQAASAGPAGAGARGEGAGGAGGDARAAGAGHAQHTETAAEVRADPADRCDLGFNTARYNQQARLVHHQEDHEMVGEVGFSLEEWAEVFVDEELGSSVDDVLDELASEEIYRRHVLGGVLAHTLDPEPWIPMTDPADCQALATELGAARQVTVQFPTVADALAGGYTLGDSYYAGLGVHYQNWDYLSSFDPGKPVQLLYDGTAPDSRLVGLSYVVAVPDGRPPEGFTGENDRWHRHRHYCLDLANGAVNLSSDVLSEQECAELGGTHMPNPNGWMLHVWVAPGCESDWGIFSGANPRLPYLPQGTSLAPGCNSGKAVTDRLEMDDSASGPSLD